MAIQKRKVEKASKDYLFYDEDYCEAFICPYNCDPGCLEYEENLLTNFRNKDKIKRKENKW